MLGVFLLSFALTPLLGLSFFPRTDPGQFVINVKAPAGTRIELTNEYIARVEQSIRDVIPAKDLGMIVSNIGATPDFSAIYTPNSTGNTAFVQVALTEDRSKSSFAYMDIVRRKLANDLPELSTYFQTGGLVDSVVNLGLPAPIDVQVSGNSLHEAFATASQLATQFRRMPGVIGCPDPAGHRLPGAATERQSRDGRATRSQFTRGDRQRHHRPEFQRHDCAQLLRRPALRQQLPAHRPVP